MDQAGIWVRRQKGQVRSQVQRRCTSCMAFAGDFPSWSLSFLICVPGPVLVAGSLTVTEQTQSCLWGPSGPEGRQSVDK